MINKNMLNENLGKIAVTGLNELFSIARTMDNVISLGVGEPDFDTPWHIRNEAIYNIDKGNTFYTENIGFLELRKEICNYLKRRYQLTYDCEKEIVCTVGGTEGIDIVMRAILNPGDEVILPQPGYVSYKPSIQLSYGVAVDVELKEENDFKLKKEDLEKAITSKTKALILNFPGNPTGGIMTKEDYMELVPLIKKHNIIVVTDEIYAEITYGTKHFSIAQIEEIKDQVILLNGFSKAYSMTGWRLGYVCGHEIFLSAIQKVHQYATMCPPTISQYAGIEAMKNGDSDAEMMRDSFEQRRNVIVHGLNAMGLTCKQPQGAFYVFPCIKSTGFTSKEFCTKLLQEERVAVVPGNEFGLGGEGYIRISYAYSMEEIKEALERIERFVSKYIQ